MGFIHYFFITLLALLSTWQAQADSTPPQIRSIPFSLIASHPRPTDSFTQGLVYEAPFFYESSGLYGRSFIRRYNQRQQQQANLAPRLFAEGLTILQDQLFVLTWRSGLLLVFDKDTLTQKQRLAFKGEGWGLTTDGKQLIMSDGSTRLSFRDPKTFAMTKELTVAIDQLNELEYHQGIIWANRWFDDAIYAIDATEGCLLGKVDLSSLRTEPIKANGHNVLNGIAFDHTQQGFWVTGKFWPKRYLIRINITQRQC